MHHFLCVLFLNICYHFDYHKHIQIDLCIAVAGVSHNHHYYQPEAKEKKDLNIDQIKDVKKKLDAADCIYYADDLKKGIDQQEHLKPYNKDRPVIEQRKVNNLVKFYGKLKEKLTKSKGQASHQTNRFGLFFDRKNCKETKTSNEFILYEQIKKVRTIPTDYVPEWFVNATRECLIPGKDHDDDKETNDNNDKSERSIGAMDAIGATDALGGQLLSFNFVVEAEDQIKIHIIWNGQTS